MKKTLFAASLVTLGLFAGQALAAPVMKSAAQLPEDGLMQLAQSAEVPAEVQAVVNEAVDLSALSNQDLAARIRKLASIVQDKNLPHDYRKQVREKVQEARAEMQKRRAERDAKKKDGGKKPAVNEEASQPEAGQGETPVVKPVKPVKPNKPEVVTQPEQPAENAQAPAAAPEKAAAGQLDGNAGDSASEAQARKYFDTASATASLGDRELRRRLNEMRLLLASNKLSGKTEKELRGALAQGA